MQAPWKAQVYGESAGWWTPFCVHIERGTDGWPINEGEASVTSNNSDRWICVKCRTIFVWRQTSVSSLLGCLGITLVCLAVMLVLLGIAATSAGNPGPGIVMILMAVAACLPFSWFRKQKMAAKVVACPRCGPGPALPADSPAAQELLVGKTQVIAPVPPVTTQHGGNRKDRVSYQCNRCGAALPPKATVSPQGDVKCEHCGGWFNIHS